MCSELIEFLKGAAEEWKARRAGASTPVGSIKSDIPVAQSPGAECYVNFHRCAADSGNYASMLVDRYLLSVDVLVIEFPERDSETEGKRGRAVRKNFPVIRGTMAGKINAAALVPLISREQQRDAGPRD